MADRYVRLGGALLAHAMAIAIACAACGGDGGDGFPAVAAPPNFPGGSGDCDGGPCTERVIPNTVCGEGSTRRCEKELAEHDGVVSCYEGTETCVGGAWSACVPPPFAGDAGSPATPH